MEVMRQLHKSSFVRQPLNIVLGSSRREFDPRDLILGNGIRDPISKNKTELLLLSLCVEIAADFLHLMRYSFDIFPSRKDLMLLK